MTNETKNIIPIIPLKGGIVLPGGNVSISIGRRRSLRAAQHAFDNDQDVLILVQYDSKLDDPDDKDLMPIGILASVTELRRKRTTEISAHLIRRVHFEGLVERSPYYTGRYSEIEEIIDGPDEALLAEAIAYLEEYALHLGEVNRNLVTDLRQVTHVGVLADRIATLLKIPLEVEKEILLNTNGFNRLELTIGFLKKEIRIVEMRNKIQREAREGADKAQKDFMLREQIKAIQKELGNDTESVIDELKRRIAEAEMPEMVLERANKELKRLARQGDHSAEAGVIRNYLEWLVDLPWNTATTDNLDIKHVREVLDTDHYGLDDVKDRIVEYVAVRKLAGNKMRGAIINLNGPPGVGKTSIATSVARAIGREMVRISLGGVRDEAEIRGHRRTYIGAIPGRIIRSLRDVKTNNPVIVLDEIDKVGSDWRGDPSSALLEVLDPEQNHSFTDHYLEVPFDLSQTIFITTSNNAHKIPAPLFDRMETISMTGYIEDEKIKIATNYLVRKQLEGHGLNEGDVTFNEDALRKVIRRYTYEAGVRQLERQIGTLVRKSAVRVASGEKGPFTITRQDVLEHLGPEKFTYGTAEEEDEVGVVTGLAVTRNGGDLTKIEVSLSEGNGKLILTGSIGNVMQESAKAALTYARAHARELGLKPSVFDKTNIHIHFPAGATRKDGPSAGVGVTTAIISAFTNRPSRKDIAMTGEVTLRGKVLPIGGLKSKSIAAHRAGIEIVIYPKDNEKDVPELPERVVKDLNLIPVSSVKDVLEIALREPAGPAWGADWGSKNSGTPTPPVPETPKGSDRPIQA